MTRLQPYGRWRQVQAGWVVKFTVQGTDYCVEFPSSSTFTVSAELLIPALEEIWQKGLLQYFLSTSESAPLPPLHRPPTTHQRMVMNREDVAAYIQKQNQKIELEKKLADSEVGGTIFAAKLAKERVLGSVMKVTNYRFVHFTSAYEPVDAATRVLATEKDGISLFSGRLFCFSGSVPYKWLFPKCVVALHHGGSGSTSAACMRELHRNPLSPDEDDDISIKESASGFTRSIDFALSSQVKANASKISQTLSSVVPPLFLPRFAASSKN
ncbi:hypothetical protein L2E82_43725 [Cichorium intybus]|uniref:Uncharacterized protein n=1 Tax=Cichorium intybus TaxID=13427 RepID=A0ACB8ZPZ5_CICIN|nr:hypothetical protein L2E82_43725 [Cichorium intybus]